MTKTNEDIERFIELRARGLSLDKIAQETGTSKPVLLKWSKDFQRELDEAQYFELQDILSQYGIMRRGRVEVISETLQKALTELRSRAQAGNFGDLPTDKLLKVVLMLEARLERETGSRRLEFSDARNLDYMLEAFVDVD
jgi:transcriptional regulator with XRE-family HTH domain